MRLISLGVGAQASPVHRPAGLLVSHQGVRVMLDGGPGAEPGGNLAAWLVCDERSELRAAIRRLARARGLEAVVASFARGGLKLTARRVAHTNHPTFGYLIETAGARVVWAPEFIRFPAWARGADVMFAEAAGWDRPIRFTGGVGGHMAALDVANAARRAGVKRLVFAHLGKPTLRALAQGRRPPFGEMGRDGQNFIVGSKRARVPICPAWSGTPSLKEGRGKLTARKT